MYCCKRSTGQLADGGTASSQPFKSTDCRGCTSAPATPEPCRTARTSQVKCEQRDVVVLFLACGAAAALHGQRGGAQHPQVQAAAKVPGLRRRVGGIPAILRQQDTGVQAG